MITLPEVEAAFTIVTVIAEVIRDVCKLRDGLGLPEGELYAQVMGKLTLEQFNSVLRILEQSGVITRSNNLIQWVEPTGSSSTVAAR